MMRLFKFFALFCLLALVGFSQAVGAEEDINIQLVRVKSHDGVYLTGVLRRPRMSKEKACIVLIHGYSGNFYSGVMAFLPEALTNQGFATLAINMRDHDRGPKKNRFEENRYDIGAAVEKMDHSGYSPIFLYGHSMGSNRVLYYLEKTHDPRIKGAILTGPPGNLFQWNIRMFGLKTAEQVLRRAQDLVTGGKGDQWMLVNLGPLGKALYTANHVVSLRGANTVSDPFKNIAKISRPILIVQGMADHLVDPNVADRLRNSAMVSSEVTVVKIPGADHRFDHHRQDLVNIIHRWLVNRLQGR
ncbi:MAG: alpha/beta hydrolase [Desulfobacterales bacterium]|nr:alpha/beta hydrolase [Desulfobacterales bacterium]